MMKIFLKRSILVTAILITVVTCGARISNAEGEVVNLTIRNGANVIYNDSVPLRPTGMISLDGHDLIANSVLSALHDADVLSTSFAITDLQYYDTMGSFYLNCINSACNNWQYTVNDSYSDTGMDKFPLSGGDNIYLYFGPHHKFSINSSSITTKEDLIVNGQNYVYESNDWEPLTGVTIGVTQPDPSKPWSPIEVATNPIGDDGQVTFSSLPVGNYNVGIQEDYYTPSESLTVVEAPVKRTGSSGSSVGPIEIQLPEKTFSIPSALEFLSKNENDDGSFGDSLYTDWVAVGIAKAGDEAKTIETKISDYLKNNDLMSKIVTDNERRAMALMSLGINPYTGTKTDYIKKIANSFDGVQIGDKSLYNDDIFALLVLSHAGYRDEDEIISKIVSNIISSQSADGSWGSVDMTSAGIQALSNFKNISGVDESITKAQSYLKNSQKEDGGFENVSSTSWAIQAMSLDDSLQTEVDKAIEYIADKQLEDGGLNQEEINNRIWSTSYAIPAVLKLSWNDILESFPKEEVNVPDISEVETTPERVVKVAPSTIRRESGKNLPKFVEKEVVENNLLSANVGESTQNQIVVDEPVKHTIWQKVTSPFKWLFIKLGF